MLDMFQTLNITALEGLIGIAIRASNCLGVIRGFIGEAHGPFLVKYP